MLREPLETGFGVRDDRLESAPGMKVPMRGDVEYLRRGDFLEPALEGVVAEPWLHTKESGDPHAFLACAGEPVEMRRSRVCLALGTGLRQIEIRIRHHDRGRG